MKFLGVVEREDGYIPAVSKITSHYVTVWDMRILVAPFTKWVAVDQDGSVFCFDGKPTRVFDNQWVLKEGRKVRYCGKADLEGMDWQLALIEIV